MMELLKQETFPHNRRLFEIHTYRDRIRERLLLEAFELADGKQLKLAGIYEEVPLGEKNTFKDAQEHPRYLSAMANIRYSVIIHSYTTFN